jgi:hypothetical protein
MLFSLIKYYREREKYRDSSHKASFENNTLEKLLFLFHATEKHKGNNNKKLLYVFSRMNSSNWSELQLHRCLGYAMSRLTFEL